MANTLAEQHEEDVQYVADRYLEALQENLLTLFEKGQIPGVKVPSKAELRQFFESTNATYWSALAAFDPAEAMAQTAQWELAQTPNQKKESVNGYAP